MNNPLDLFTSELRETIRKQHLTQRALAERLHMSVRTIIEIEGCKSRSLRASSHLSFRLHHCPIPR